MLNYEKFRIEQKAARNEGKFLGVGFSTYIESCGLAPSAWVGVGENGEGWGAGLWESANIRIHLTGKAVVTTGSSPHGQGTETTMAQIAADELGLPIEDVEVKYNDTLGTPFGYGTYGSRSASVGGAALYNGLPVSLFFLPDSTTLSRSTLLTSKSSIKSNQPKRIFLVF